MPTTPTTFLELVNLFLDFLNLLVPVVFSVLFAFIVWKIIDVWVINATDESKRSEGRQMALVAVVVMVIMLITWGIVALLQTSFFGQIATGG